MKYLVNLTSGVIHLQDTKRDKNFDFDLQPFGDESQEDRHPIEDDMMRLPGVVAGVKKGLIAVLDEDELEQLDDTCAAVKPSISIEVATEKTLKYVQCVGTNVVKRPCTHTVAMTDAEMKDRPPLCPSCTAQSQFFEMVDSEWRDSRTGLRIRVQEQKPLVEVFLLPTGDEDMWSPSK